MMKTKIKNTNFFKVLSHGTFVVCIFLALTGCQIPPTNVVENDLQLEDRAFSKVDYGKKFELKKSVIIDTRTRFEHEMSKPPRSFNVYWKDWDLRGYRGVELEEKKRQLQRLLSLKAIDQYTSVVVLGKGLSGKGEEFFVAATLMSLGVTKINFINIKKLKDSLVSKDIPDLENLPYWEEPLKYNFECPENAKADVTIKNPKDYFKDDLSIKQKSFPKGLKLQLASKDPLWAYGAAIYLTEQGRKVCVIR